jgi:hypothetical protein
MDPDITANKNIRFIMMPFSILIDNYGAKIYKKIGKANFKGVKLINGRIFLPC